MYGSLIQKGEKEEMMNMTMWKKWFLLSTGVASCFIINNLEVKAEATEEYSYEIKDDGTIKLTEYLGNSEYVEVPETIDGIPVTELENTFSVFTWVSSVYIPASIEEISGPQTFGSTALENIEVDEASEYFRDEDGILFDKEMTVLYAYPQKKMENTYYRVPDGVIRIEDNAFWYANIEELELPDSLEEIGETAFFGMKITDIYIPENVDSIGEACFFSCKSLNNIEVDEKNDNYEISNGALIDKENECLLAYPMGCTETDYFVPEGITRIGRDAFHECENLENVILPESLVEIGEGAFSYCRGLKSVEVPLGVQYILEDTFAGCVALDYVTIPDTVISIDSFAFSGCDELKELYLPKSVNAISSYAFDDDLTLLVEQYSSANIWAEENGQPYRLMQ